jgi:hypothetical protein
MLRAGPDPGSPERCCFDAIPCPRRVTSMSFPTHFTSQWITGERVLASWHPEPVRAILVLRGVGILCLHPRQLYAHTENCTIKRAVSPYFLASRACQRDLGVAWRRNPELAPHRPSIITNAFRTGSLKNAFLIPSIQCLSARSWCCAARESCACTPQPLLRARSRTRVTHLVGCDGAQLMRLWGARHPSRSSSFALRNGLESVSAISLVRRRTRSVPPTPESACSASDD